MGTDYLKQALLDRYLPGSPPARELTQKLSELNDHFTSLFKATLSIAKAGINDQNVIPFYRELCNAAGRAQLTRGELLSHLAPLFPRLLLWDDQDYPKLVRQFQKIVSESMPLTEEEAHHLRQELSSGLLMEEFGETFAALLGYLISSVRALKFLELLASEKQLPNQAALTALLSGELARQYNLICENIAGLHKLCFGLDSIYNLNP